MPQPRSTYRSRSSTAALAIVFGLLVAGCDGDAGPPGPPSPGTSTPAATSSVPAGTPTPSEPATSGPATPEPTAASSDGPAANIPLPEKPALADKNTVEGLEAFTEYWFDLLNYAYATNDWAPLEAVTDSGCETCMAIKGEVQRVYGDGSWLKGAEIDVMSFSSEFALNTSGSISSFVQKRQSEVTYFDSDGSELSRDPMTEPVFDVVIALHESDRWLMLDYGKPEGT
ncbi:DUF6318 family protein [Arthrobacter sp. HLT1-21]